ncbi:hypothetical protein L284_12695 [Novosphingobium lindaniclasticum LE124]|uniref:Uncharacterized protein n=1 Tax=Novosphingobium lindaniclasticum LE124 TaxID=1096930 RepID=T0ISL4_9SPHN|nr:hypothetical protein L284_12695 [Novosphingobium lindaniclasticum LE124]
MMTLWIQLRPAAEVFLVISLSPKNIVRGVEDRLCLCI